MSYEDAAANAQAAAEAAGREAQEAARAAEPEAPWYVGAEDAADAPWATDGSDNDADWAAPTSGDWGGGDE